MQFMFINTRLGSFLLVTLLCTSAASVQQNPPRTQAGNRRLFLDVVVTTKSGPPVAGLQQQDFTILDNKVPQTITSFQTITGREAPIEVIVVLDAVNANLQTVEYERIQIDKFLHTDGGHLAYPIAVEVFTDKGIELVGDFSSDGNALSTSLQQEDIGRRVLGRSAGFNGGVERMQLSINALRKLIARETPRPERKVVLWVSPGWPLLTSTNVELSWKLQEQVFADIVSLSTQLIRARMKLYNMHTLGADETMMSASYYKDFLKGVTKPSQAEIADVSLQVLAIQSGGIVFSPSNDIAGLLQECVTDSAPYYEISFDTPPADQRDEYHSLEVKLAKPGLIARTRQGYYAQPLPRN
jgi:VWFA-related protein